MTLSLFTSLGATAPSVARAEAPSAEATKDAGRHFQRGVALFNEADYAGALVEFKRAHEIAPNPAVLFNIAQTHFQLRSYAAALASFERYVAESPPSAEHRSEAQTAIETLRSRVGKIDIVAPDGAEITVDDEVAGRAPLPPVLAAIGKRKVAATTRDGRPVPARFVEISAGETVKIELKVEESSRPVASVSAPAADKAGSSMAPTVAWVATGALTAGAAVTGILALGASTDLEDARRQFPTARATLDDTRDRAKTFALVTDVLAAGAIVAAGVALYLTLRSHESPRTGRVVRPASYGFGGSF